MAAAASWWFDDLLKQGTDIKLVVPNSNHIIIIIKKLYQPVC